MPVVAAICRWIELSRFRRVFEAYYRDDRSQSIVLFAIGDAVEVAITIGVVEDQLIPLLAVEGAQVPEAVAPLDDIGEPVIVVLPHP